MRSIEQTLAIQRSWLEPNDMYIMYETILAKFKKTSIIDDFTSLWLKDNTGWNLPAKDYSGQDNRSIVNKLKYKSDTYFDMNLSSEISSYVFEKTKLFKHDVHKCLSCGGVR